MLWWSFEFPKALVSSQNCERLLTIASQHSGLEQHTASESYPIETRYPKRKKETLKVSESGLLLCTCLHLTSASVEVFIACHDVISCLLNNALSYCSSKRNPYPEYIPLQTPSIATAWCLVGRRVAVLRCLRLSMTRPSRRKMGRGLLPG